MTVISRKVAARLGFVDNYTTHEGVELSGFAGKCVADVKEIPGIIVGGRYRSRQNLF